MIPDEPAAAAAQGRRRRSSRTARSPIELEQVLDDLYPLLRTVQPAELNSTLNALATALEGRGDQLGDNLETLDGYLKRMNPQMPALIDDLKLLGHGLRHLRRRAARDLAATLRNTVKTGNTLVDARSRSSTRSSTT